MTQEAYDKIAYALREAHLVAELDASRAREAKLVEALREARVSCLMIFGSSAQERTLRDLALGALDAALAPYIPAEMPADCHPQGE